MDGGIPVFNFLSSSTMSPPPCARRQRAYDNKDENDKNLPTNNSLDSEEIEICADMSASELYKVRVENIVELTMNYENH
jgi:hypothetical protein